MGVFNIAAGKAGFPRRTEGRPKQRYGPGVLGGFRGFAAEAFGDSRKWLGGQLDLLSEVIGGGTNSSAPRRNDRAPIIHGANSVMEEAPEWLVSLSKSQRREHRLVMRAQMVLATVFEKKPISAVARALGTTRDTVRLWASRYLAKSELISLTDLHRTGRPPRIGVKETGVVVSLACQRIEDIEGCLEGRLTQRLITELAREKGVHVSRSSTQRILADGLIKPHLNQYFLFTPKDHPEYESRRAAICDLYVRDLDDDEIIYCIDEKPGIQALERVHPGKGASPGRYPLIEFEYRRHGTVNLVAALNVGTGELAHYETAHRWYSHDMVAFFKRLIAKTPKHIRKIHIVWDNGSTHTSKETRNFLEGETGCRLVTHYTPKHASWLNQAELFFSIFSRRYLRGRSYGSRDQLVTHIDMAVIDYSRWAKPIRWKYNPATESPTEPMALAA
jgi:transposase